METSSTFAKLSSQALGLPYLAVSCRTKPMSDVEDDPARSIPESPLGPEMSYVIVRLTIAIEIAPPVRLR